MKIIIFIIFLFLIESCNQKLIQNERKIYFYHTILNRHGLSDTDTLLSRKNIRHSKDDTLIGKYNFQFNDDWHTIKMFTSVLHAPIDGGDISYELDSLGIIYHRSTTWYACEWIRSNDGSINTLIDAAIANILMHPKLFCYPLKSIYKSKIKFKTPKVQ